VKQFILISFGFLGWTFYEMSGGKEFEPASVRLAHLMPVKAEEAPKAEPVAIVAAAEPAVEDTDPPSSDDVTRVSLNLNALEETLAEVTITELEPAQTDEDGFGVPRNVGTITSSVDTPAIIPSLIAPNSETTQVAVVSGTAGGDIRTVSGNRVNVRGGPSTEFDVVTRLVRGEEVEILQDDGNGWVRMRPVNGGTGGWMADFLLTGG
jgi:hypothetical protein